MPDISNLTEAQYRALRLASIGKLTEAHAHIQTLDLLWERGWITWRNGKAIITEAGGAMLDPVRLLGLAGGYTDQPSLALPQEPEAVDEDAQERITDKADRTTTHYQTIERVRKDHAWDLLTFEDRLTALRRESNRIGLNLSSEFRALERLKNKTPNDPQSSPAVVRQLRRITQAVHTKAA